MKKTLIVSKEDIACRPCGFNLNITAASDIEIVMTVEAIEELIRDFDEWRAMKDYPYRTPDPENS